jgi:hypothetical protein
MALDRYLRARSRPDHADTESLRHSPSDDAFWDRSDTRTPCRPGRHRTRAPVPAHRRARLARRGGAESDLMRIAGWSSPRCCRAGAGAGSPMDRSVTAHRHRTDHGHRPGM